MSLPVKVGVLTTLGAPLLPLLLRSLVDAGVTGIAVIADSRAPGEKDRRFWQQRTGGAFDGLGLDLHDFAADGIAFHLVRSHNGEDCVGLLQRLQPSLLVNGGTPRKLNEAMLALPGQGILNVHPGLLPRYRGANCVEWAIWNDDPVGNSAHFMTSGYDEGPIIEARPCPISPGDDYVGIRVKVYAQGVAMMAETVASLLANGRTAADLPAQPPGDQFRPMSDEQIAAVIAKVAAGRYAPRDAA
jgi:methionyl-tRNA formyltransferase